MNQIQTVRESLFWEAFAKWFHGIVFFVENKTRDKEMSKIIALNVFDKLWNRIFVETSENMRSFLFTTATNDSSDFLNLKYHSHYKLSKKIWEWLKSSGVLQKVFANELPLLKLAHVIDKIPIVNDTFKKYLSGEMVDLSKVDELRLLETMLQVRIFSQEVAPIELNQLGNADTLILLQESPRLYDFLSYKITTKLNKVFREAVEEDYFFCQLFEKDIPKTELLLQDEGRLSFIRIKFQRELGKKLLLLP